MIQKTNKFIIFILLMLIFNSNTASANYEKVIYDFKIKSINGGEINLSNIKGKHY